MSTEEAKTESKEVTTLYVMGFPNDLRYREVHNLFRFKEGYERCSVNLRRTYPTVFVTFTTREQADAAMNDMQGFQFDPDVEQSVLRIEFAKSNTASRGGSRGERSTKRSRSEAFSGMPSYAPPQQYAPAPMAMMARPPTNSGGPRRGPRGNPIQTLFVHSCDGASEDDLRALASQQPGFLQMRTSTKNGLVAWVHFSSTEYATAACQGMEGVMLGGMYNNTGLQVDYAKKPMSYQGGGGGGGGGNSSAYAMPMQGMAMDSMYSSQFANPYGYQ